jgi:glucokinase
MEVPKSLVGLDIGGSQIKALAFRSDGGRLSEETVTTLDDGTQAWLERVRAVANRIVASCPTPVCVGLAAPGLVAADRRSIAFMPGRLSGLEGLDWEKSLNLGVPVNVFNDAQAALLGEVWLGAAKGVRNVTMLTLGTGVGGAVMVDGRILHGHIGRAGHLGHVSLNPDGPLDIARTPGSLEDAIGECSLALRSERKYSSTRELVAHYRQGSAEAERIWLASIKALAVAVAGFVNVLDPELVVIGGGIADADDALFGPLQAGLDQFEWRPGGARVRVVKAALGRNAGAAGAAYGAKLAAEIQDGLDCEGEIPNLTRDSNCR